MLKIISQFSPSILQIRVNSYSQVVKPTKRTNQKLLCNTKLNLRSMYQNRGFAEDSLPSVQNINYGQLKEFINENKVLIIDVRIKEEIASTGVLPNSSNIPLYELSTAFELTPDGFLEKYNISKPDKDQCIVFSCAKGIRSLKACQYAMELGYKNVFNYTEGWFGWESHK